MVTSTAGRRNRIVFWFLSTATVMVLLFGYHTSTSGPDAEIAAGPTPPSVTASSAASGTTDDTTTNDAGTSTVAGDAEDTRWGPVQVELTIDGGKITDVAVPVYPNNNGRDAEINSYALPQLVQETISAQSASIDMVSGATVTSDGYIRSLQSALDKAGL